MKEQNRRRANHSNRAFARELVKISSTDTAAASLSKWRNSGVKKFAFSAPTAPSVMCCWRAKNVLQRHNFKRAAECICVCALSLSVGRNKNSNEMTHFSDPPKGSPFSSFFTEHNIIHRKFLCYSSVEVKLHSTQNFVMLASKFHEFDDASFFFVGSPRKWHPHLSLVRVVCCVRRREDEMAKSLKNAFKDSIKSLTWLFDYSLASLLSSWKAVFESWGDFSIKHL